MTNFSSPLKSLSNKTIQTIQMLMIVSIMLITVLIFTPQSFYTVCCTRYSYITSSESERWHLCVTCIKVPSALRGRFTSQKERWMTVTFIDLLQCHAQLSPTRLNNYTSRRQCPPPTSDTLFYCNRLPCF